ncbi:MAG TPA: butyrate kinase [Papillibacter sp.]|nr:butyrate kinase [Papillibacter sp.]
MKTYRILAINPGSTSTKVALFENEMAVFNVNIEHDAGELNQFPEVSDQKPYRLEKIKEVLREHGVDFETIDAYVGRGGGQEALEGGTYRVSDLAYEHARIGYRLVHPCILGSQLARDLGDQYGKPSFFVNPPCVDELIDEARVSGMKEILRRQNVHALNQKEVAKRYAKSIGKRYEDTNLIVCHIGGGLSVTAHRKGRMVDTNDCLGSSGPFSPTRSGDVSAIGLLRMCFSGKYTEKEIYNKITKNGGLVDYLGTNDVREVRARIAKGDKYAELILAAMFHQIKKEIGAMSAVLEGDVQAIVLSGGVSYDEKFVESVRKSCGFIAPVVAMPGEFEMEALARGALAVLAGEEEAKEYTGISPVNPELFGDAIW